MLRTILATPALLALAGCSLLTSVPRRATHEGRLAAFPSKGLPLDQPVDLYWSDELVPFIRADTDGDAAFVLGLVHAHLRGGQMELFRRIAAGRVSELVGPLGVDVDKTLRILGLGRASPAIAAKLPPSTRAWLQRFVDGVNWSIDHARDDALPHEYRALAMRRERWRIEDVITLGRLAGADLTWLVYQRALRLVGEQGSQEALAELIGRSARSAPTAQGAALWELEGIVGPLSRSGSNSLVVAGSKSATGAALMANDPHVGIFAPNFWMLAGLQSPSYHVVGVWIPGLPFAGIGRNPDIAWGGTNMRGISSHLYALGPEELARAEVRTEPIRVRAWPDTEVQVRTTPFGPVISDAPLFESKQPLALRWLGHDPSDEITAFLEAMRAADWAGFRKAFEGYRVSAMNLTYADARGHIGQVLAYGQPVLRDPARTLDLIKQTDNPVVAVRGPLELPEVADPAEGFLASANNRPAATEIPIAFQYASSDRVERMQQLAGGRVRVTVEDLKEWQRDVYSASSHGLAREVARRCEGIEREFGREREGGLEGEGWERERELWRAFVGWDGHYRSGAAGPVAFEALLHGLAGRLRRRMAVSPKVADLLFGADNWKGTVRAELGRLDDASLRADVLEALRERSSALRENPTWGAMHVQRIQHPLGSVPLVGGRYRVLDYGADGSNDTLLKAAHDFTGGRSRVSYGATARHVSDLSDPDANWFVLLGGQDGWLDGPHLADQVPLWREGRYLHLPLRIEAVEREFSTRVRLQPGRP